MRPSPTTVGRTLHLITNNNGRLDLAYFPMLICRSADTDKQLRHILLLLHTYPSRKVSARGMRAGISFCSYVCQRCLTKLKAFSKCFPLVFSKYRMGNEKACIETSIDLLLLCLAWMLLRELVANISKI